MTEKKNPDRRVIKTKKAIKSAFIKLLTERDINDITVSDIAELADINRKTFYNYYAGMHELMDEIENELIGKIDEVLTEFDFTENKDTPYLVFGKLTSVINTDEELFGLLLGAQSNPGLTLKLVEMLKAKTKAVLMKYFKVREDKLDLMLEFMVPGMVAVYQRWFRSDRSKPLESVNSDINTLVFSGIKGYLDILFIDNAG